MIYEWFLITGFKNWLKNIQNYRLFYENSDFNSLGRAPTKKHPNKIHFLPPGVASTTGLSHNPFTWRPL